MPINKEITTWVYDVPIPDGIKAGDKKEFLDKVGQYLVDSMLDKIGEGMSPVKGNGKFPLLKKDYAEHEHGGERKPILDAHGDMLQALTYKIVGNSLEIGIFDSDQAIKSYNHNVGDTLPKRQFIPNEGETLKADIMRGIGDITDEYIY